MIDYDTDAFDAYGVVSSGFAEVIQLMPIITPYTLTEDTTGGVYYATALDQINTDAPTMTGIKASKTMCYYIAHLMYSMSGGIGITSEKLDDAAVTYADNGNTSPYYMMYLKTIESYKKGTLKNMSLDGVAHQDSESMYIFGVYTDV